MNVNYDKSQRFLAFFQFGTNFRNCINSWNIGTNHWLRMVVYERLPNSKNVSTLRTVLTFMMSAIWHGFYPGYYVTFATGALIVTAARIVSINWIISE